LQPAGIPAPSTKGKAVQPILDSAKEHLLVTTEINGHAAKTLIDQQTAGADLISSKFCTLHNLPLYNRRPPITLQITMKGSQGSISHYTKANCDWKGWSEERVFYVAGIRDWDVILGSPSLRHTKAFINMETMKVSVQPPGCQRFTLAPWKITVQQKPTRKREIRSQIPLTPAAAHKIIV